MAPQNCIFCQIGSGELDADIVLEDDEILAFRDINPRAPTHILIIPRRHIATLNDLEDQDALLFGRMVLAARRLAGEEAVAEPGYRLVCNCNPAAGQIVYHVHLHLIGGRRLGAMAP